MGPLQRIHEFVAARRSNDIVRPLDDPFTDRLRHPDSHGLAHCQNQSHASDILIFNVSNLHFDLVGIPEVFVDQFDLVGIPGFFVDSKIGSGLDRPAQVPN